MGSIALYLTSTVKTFLLILSSAVGNSDGNRPSQHRKVGFGVVYP